MSVRQYRFSDRLLMQFDQGLRTLFGQPLAAGRANPAEINVADNEDVQLTPAAQRRAGRLMRVNHTGEVCAQALYQGQAVTAKHEAVRSAMQQAALEEGDHLIWCQQRLQQLNSRSSVLNPLFYAGSFSLGVIAGRLGDRWSLGFLAETENQVVRHLDKYIDRLPEQDHQSRRILATMRQDEAQHASKALQAGGEQLPWPVRTLMAAGSKLMTKTTYWL